MDIGSRRECFFDTALLEEKETTAVIRLHPPVRRGPVIVHDEPWEGNACGYHIIVRDGSRYRMYYRGWTILTDTQLFCYAESTDGIRWEKPELGICEWNGSRKNNILFTRSTLPVSDNFYVFLDDSPDCLPEQRFKAAALSGTPEKPELLSFFSADGIRFAPGHVLTDEGRFDSVNVVFRDSLTGKYRCYFRRFHPAEEDGRYIRKGEPVRDIRTMESEDFVRWTSPVLIRGMAEEEQQLYTNNLQPYYRAPHIYVGFPTRYIERRCWDDSFEQLCGKESRREKMKLGERLGLALTDTCFMTSRDGIGFRQYEEAWCSPGSENPQNWFYGDCYFAYGMIETPGDRPGSSPEISLYCPEDYWAPEPPKLVRYTSRLDGFASLRADGAERTVLTKPFVYEGSELRVNFSTSAWGFVSFALIDGEGHAFESAYHFGDSTDRKIPFPDEAVRKLSGSEVRLRVRMRDADLYSIRFCD